MKGFPVSVLGLQLFGLSFRVPLPFFTRFFTKKKVNVFRVHDMGSRGWF